MAKTRTPIFELRRFGITMAIILAIAAAFCPWQGRWAGPVCLGASGMMALVAVFCPNILKPFEWAWMKFSRALGVVTTFLILTLTYYLLLTPIGLIMRLAGKPGLKLKWDRDASGYWEPVETDGPSQRLDKPF
ncbi:MAG: SxtJ family membrane protein [candidate division Zixibacteria bacterium]|nr:SxtJ family membrane protein [candidate division Zixibacteria bacterium]